jgi:hypothetical protein
MRLQAVRVGRVERKRLPAILHREAEAVGTDRRTETRINALNQRDHISFTVGRSQVDRIGIEPRVSRPNVRACPSGIDEPCPLARIAFRDEPIDRYVREAGIGVIAGAIFEGEFLCFDEQMQVLRRVRRKSVNVELLEQV